MPDGVTFESFQRELARLVDIFGKNLAAYKSGGYDEASLRQESSTRFSALLAGTLRTRPTSSHNGAKSWPKAGRMSVQYPRAGGLFFPAAAIDCE